MVHRRQLESHRLVKRTLKNYRDYKYYRYYRNYRITKKIGKQCLACFPIKCIQIILLVETCITLSGDTIYIAIGRIIIAESNIKYDTIVRHTMQVDGLSFQNFAIGYYCLTCTISIVVY